MKIYVKVSRYNLTFIKLLFTAQYKCRSYQNLCETFSQLKLFIKLALALNQKTFSSSYTFIFYKILPEIAVIYPYQSETNFLFHLVPGIIHFVQILGKG